MRLLSLVACFALAAGPVFAEPAPTAKPAKASVKAKRAKSSDAQPGCKRKVVGRGLDRKVVCELEATIEVKSGQPKPGVLIVAQDGKSVVGRPKQTDPLAGLSRRLRD